MTSSWTPLSAQVSWDGAHVCMCTCVYLCGCISVSAYGHRTFIELYICCYLPSIECTSYSGWFLVIHRNDAHNVSYPYNALYSTTQHSTVLCHAYPWYKPGAVKVTPFHDARDYECGKRHSLPMIQVIGYDGTMTHHAGSYSSLNRFAARERVIEDLKVIVVICEPRILIIIAEFGPIRWEITACNGMVWYATIGDF